MKQIVLQCLSLLIHDDEGHAFKPLSKPSEGQLEPGVFTEH